MHYGNIIIISTANIVLHAIKGRPMKELNDRPHPDFFSPLVVVFEDVNNENK